MQWMMKLDDLETIGLSLLCPYAHFIQVAVTATSQVLTALDLLMVFFPQAFGCTSALALIINIKCEASYQQGDSGMLLVAI